MIVMYACMISRNNIRNTPVQTCYEAQERKGREHREKEEEEEEEAMEQ